MAVIIKLYRGHFQCFWVPFRSGTIGTLLRLCSQFLQALGEKQGIVRMAHAFVPMDDALALVAVDISGRGYAVLDITFDDKNISDLPASLVSHFLESLASEARLNLHAQVFKGNNDHHKAEATFKALARALDAATRIDDRIRDRIPSTKSVID